MKISIGRIPRIRSPPANREFPHDHFQVIVLAITTGMTTVFPLPWWEGLGEGEGYKRAFTPT